jgi:hypothetical protein
MATHDEKAYLYCRLNTIMKAITEIAEEISKWETEFDPQEEESK